jgi:hypothetical protein
MFFFWFGVYQLGHYPKEIAMKKKYNISKEYLEEHYVRKQKNALQIAKELGIPSKTTVLRLLKKYNIPKNVKQGKPKKDTIKFGDIHQSYICLLKIRAKRSKYEFNLDGEFLWDLFLKQNRKCALSGIEIGFPKAWGVKSKTEITASLDRIDSSKGYIKDNVQWVHKHINTMKMHMTDQQFIEICKQVAGYNK